MLRRMMFRILIVVGLIAVIIFCFKDLTWQILLAPSECDFLTYRLIERILASLTASDFRFDEYFVELIATDLSSQFMTHITTSIYLGVLFASPYILYELFRFASPALYENERKYSVRLIVTVYFLFIIGVLMSYFVIFPISFRFLGTYSVAERVRSTITLDSYVSTFTVLTLVMGMVFQLPVISFALTKFGLITSEILANYRKHSFIAIMFISAIITPPDIMTLIFVSLPLYVLYEVSIRVSRICEHHVN